MFERLSWSEAANVCNLLPKEKLPRLQGLSTSFHFTVLSKSDINGLFAANSSFHGDPPEYCFKPT